MLSKTIIFGFVSLSGKKRCFPLMRNETYFEENYVNYAKQVFVLLAKTANLVPTKQNYLRNKLIVQQKISRSLYHNTVCKV